MAIKTLDNVMVDSAPTGTALYMQKEFSEKFYRYICILDWLEEVDEAGVGLDTVLTNYTISPLIGSAGTFVIVSVLDENFKRPADPGYVGPASMLVVGDYGGGRNRTQRYSILCPLSDGQVKELIINYGCLDHPA